MYLYNNILNADHYLFQLINQFAFKWEWFDLVGVFFADYFVYFIVILLFLFLLKFRKYWKMVAKAMIAALMSRFIIVEIIRLIHPRLRPFTGDNVNLLVDKVNQFAFPSGHAAFCFAIATVIYFYNKKAGVLFFIFASLVSIARIFVGVHWPLDVLAGASVGIFSGWLINKLLKFKK